MSDKAQVGELVGELFTRRRQLIDLIGEERLEVELARVREVLAVARREGESKAATAMRVIDKEFPEPPKGLTAARKIAASIYLLAALTNSATPAGGTAKESEAK